MLVLGSSYFGPHIFTYAQLITCVRPSLWILAHLAISLGLTDLLCIITPGGVYDLTIIKHHIALLDPG